jgi:hypothetical protein
MRRKFEELRENLFEFAEQDEYTMLVVRCSSDELAYVLTFFQALEQTRDADYVLAFAQPFPSAAGYLNAVMDSVCQQVEAANLMRAEEELEPLPPVPEELLDQGKAPEQRLFGLLMYLRCLLPNEQDHRLHLGFMPLEISDWSSFVRLMRAIMPVTEVPPWMGAMRIVTWDDRQKRLLTEQMLACRTDLVLSFEIDLSTPALTDQLARDAADPTVPVMERMACLMQLAALDFSYKRYPDAIEKYGVLYRFYEEQEVPSMQALCLLGVGDVLRSVGKLPEARERLQQGIALATEANALPVLLNLLQSVTLVCMDLLELEEAESYADSGTKVAAALLNAYSYCDFFELRGDTQIAQGKHGEGLLSYAKCEELCEKYEYTFRWASVLERQIQLFSGARMRTEEREARGRLDMVRQREQGEARP